MRMITTCPAKSCGGFAVFAGAVALSLGLLVSPVYAQVTAFKQAVAEAAYDQSTIASFYREANYTPLWTGAGDVFVERRSALFQALTSVENHGLPASRYDVAGLVQQMKDARTTRDIGLVEVALTNMFLKYARDVQTGILVPSRIDSGIVRQVQYRDPKTLLATFSNTQPRAFMNSLPPSTSEYLNLMKAKIRLEEVIAQGTWGAKVASGKLEPGDGGPQVVALRNRLIAMGYMERTASMTYDTKLQQAVIAFQSAHGLAEDGVAGAGTLDEINTSAETRLQSVLVALERERWTNMERGERHVLVNLTDFSAKIVDQGEVVFKTKSVIGQNSSDRRSPEFSDVMEHMIVNPSWHVPRSIMTKEYLPQLQKNPNAARHLIITDRRGQRVNREAMDFTQFTARNFPFDMRQPPSNSNALGLVKFMFPNKYNIYLHDTPQKSLFKRETRAFSHGCIRLADPFDFAYALLSLQEDDPRGYFQSVLRTGTETKINLEKPLPVHLIYRTAVISDKGRVEFRRDVYGRDAGIWDALSEAGVALSSVQG
ncbi:MAG: L,D-transpeptidase family protein [Heliomarina sp.]|uniref:L,D-transpeptidase family protein n=1 Tax=Heliomarina sp. TaxID=2917556 RepID=UPI004057E27E